MGRTKGATNKERLAGELVLSEEERLAQLVDLILETIATEEACRQK